MPERAETAASTPRCGVEDRFPFSTIWEVRAMATDSLSTANYLAVINDLRAKRDELDRTIAMLETMANVGSSSQTSELSPPRASSTPRLEFRPTTAGTNNNGIGESCANILREHGQHRPLTTRQVTDLLVQSGFEFKTANPVNNVWSALANRSKTKRDVEKVGTGCWRYIRVGKGAMQAEGPIANGAAAH
jgi:hypothetical protein